MMMSMVEPGYSDGTGKGVPSVGDILSILDFPMESLEGEDELCGDWDESKSQSLGPIPSEALMDLLPVPGGNLRNVLNVPLKLNVPDAGIAKSKTLPNCAKQSSGKNNCQKNALSNTQESGSFQTCSPVSVLENGGSCSVGKSLPINPEFFIPVRTRSKRARASVLNPWFVMTPISPAASEAKRRKEKFSPASLGLDDSFKQGKEQPLHAPCTHCKVTTTPQWREGPMGPKTLCNACGVRYRSGRLFPEYRPLASPTFVPTLHSNCHRKVVEIRKNASIPEADVILEVAMSQALEFVPTGQSNVGRKDVGMREKAVLQEMDILYDAPMLEVTEFVPTLHSNSCGKDVGMRKEAINQEAGMIHDASMSTAPEFAAALHSNPLSNYVGMRKKAIMPEMDMIQDAPVSAPPEFETAKHSNSHRKGPGMRKKAVVHERGMTHDAPTPPATQFVPTLHSNSAKGARVRKKAIMQEIDMIHDTPMSPPPEFVPTSSYLFDFIY